MTENLHTFKSLGIGVVLDFSVALMLLADGVRVSISENTAGCNTGFVPFSVAVTAKKTKTFFTK